MPTNKERRRAADLMLKIPTYELDFNAEDGDRESFEFLRLGTEYRENAEGLTAIFTEFDFHGFESGEQEVKMLDFRHAFYRRCNWCGARGPLVKTDWHVRTEEEADDFSFGSKLWPCGPDSEWARPWRENADAEWNRRAGEGQ